MELISLYVPSTTKGFPFCEDSKLNALTLNGSLVYMETRNKLVFMGE